MRLMRASFRDPAAVGLAANTAYTEARHVTGLVKQRSCNGEQCGELRSPRPPLLADDRSSGVRPLACLAGRRRARRNFALMRGEGAQYFVLLALGNFDEVERASKLRRNFVELGW